MTQTSSNDTDTDADYCALSTQIYSRLGHQVQVTGIRIHPTYFAMLTKNIPLAETMSGDLRRTEFMGIPVTFVPSIPMGEFRLVTDRGIDVGA